MGSSVAHLVGNVATELRTSLENAGHERVSFRLIATERRRDAATGAWTDGDEFAVTVVCWGALARNVAQSVRLGDPLLVSGRLTSRRYEVEGDLKYVTELRAVQVGHDLSRGRSVFSRSAAAVGGTGTPLAEADADPHQAADRAAAGDGAVDEMLAAAF
ncbi:single-stranded DNA-binding protein [Nakamurella deserti]|uniref:single-stranded DNA-binding protein n=1 Tax=Nakamurella deserti TaxID=2164074 RepID=UPI000DBE5747|nr:single-stranded DNA-binding protein [Nakamurella deserti]